MKNENNAINPEHYNRLDPQPKDVIRSWGLNFNLGNAVKYVARAGHKDDVVQDLKKAQEYIQFEIDAIEAEKRKNTKPHHTVSNIPTPNKGCSSCLDRKDCTDAYTEVSYHCGNYGGKQYGVIELEVPVGTPPEEIIQMAIKKIYGGK